MGALRRLHTTRYGCQSCTMCTGERRGSLDLFVIYGIFSVTSYQSIPSSTALNGLTSFEETYSPRYRLTLCPHLLELPATLS